MDNRGCGDSTIPLSYNFSAMAASEDVKGVLDYHNISQTYIASHDKGAGIAAAFAANHPSQVKRAVFSEYPLPGFGYEDAIPRELNWTLYQNWQLAFFSVPNAAEFFVQGREYEMLAWYFFHASYSGNSAFSEHLIRRYAREISKVGFLRPQFEFFATVKPEAQFFNATLGKRPLTQPVLILGGEASLGSSLDIWDPIGTDLVKEVVPKAGHWIGERSLAMCEA